MQNCLQTKRKFNAFYIFVLLFWVFVIVITLTIGRDKNVQETALIGAENSKYLSELNEDKEGINKQNNVQSNIDDTKMNNHIQKNSKNEDLQEEGMHKKENNQLSTVKKFSKKIPVYFHETGKTIEMDFEEYVVGCVLAEMPSSFSAQALMAQSVAVRSFTCYKIMNNGAESHNGAVVCTDFRHCQSYIEPEEYEKKSDYSKEALAKIREAVEATSGICAFYDGKPIMAVYHASSGISTKNCSEVWGGDVPYLVSVKAPEDKNICSLDYAFDYNELERKLSGKNDSVKCFSVFGKSVTQNTGEHGLVQYMTFADGKVLNKSELQNALNLRSDDFSAQINEDEVVFTCYGYGHGVGMSQYGANALAKEGYGYMDILKYYYKGIGFSYIY